MSKMVIYQGKRPEELLVLLKEVQQKHGCASPELMTELAEALGVPVNDVYGVVSFYSFLSAKPLGRNVIKICKSLPCYIKNSQTIVDTVAREIGVKPGETTPDGRFSLQLVNCIGLCDGAPAMLVNDEPHVDLTPTKISGILKSYK